MKDKQIHTISEYDYLYYASDKVPTSWYHKIDSVSFNAIKQFIYDTPELNNYITVSSKRHYWEVISVQNYVGVLQTKQGITIEILPKIYSWNHEDIKETRKIFLKMLRRLKKSPFKKAENAHLLKKDFPILEVFISLFLDELDTLIKQWLKKSYQSHEENLTFLKGKLDPMKQLRVNFIHKERFAVTYDEFTEDCPENKLIKTCIVYLKRHASSNANQKRLREMLFIFDQVNQSTTIEKDFRLCNHANRLQNYYGNVMQWVSLFLGKQSLVSFSGKHLSLALLFPMERIFEDYVAFIMKKKFSDWTIKTQDCHHYLIENHQERSIFQLRPDIVMSKDWSWIPPIVLDTKRKLIDETNRKKKYNISQSDMYQLFAYAEKYWCQDVVLIYPKTDQFTENLAPFEYRQWKQTLHVIWFDLSNDENPIALNFTKQEIFSSIHSN